MPGCRDQGVGDPCTPEQEFEPTFNAFDEKEVNVESKSFQCQTRLCLVNHFRGRVSCPYGQDAQGNAPGGVEGPNANGCVVPGSGEKITGNPGDASLRARVRPQCSNRTAENAVYCSCRCANLEGRTDDGANYCTCPESFTCTQLVTSIGQGNEGLTGAYCVKNGTAYDPNADSCGDDCDPVAKPCGQ